MLGDVVVAAGEVEGPALDQPRAENTLVPTSDTAFEPSGWVTVVPTTRLARRKVAMQSPRAKEAGSSKVPAGRRCR